MVTAKKATGPFETQVGREKFPVGEGGGWRRGENPVLSPSLTFGALVN